MVAPKLRRTTDAYDIPAPGDAYIDSVGMFLMASLRHFDRGAGERDQGQYERLERVFGPTGAAAFYSRDLIEDVKVDGEFFDELFFAYREDADLAWWARLLGWDCVYVPHAVATCARRAASRDASYPPTSIVTRSRTGF
jgi:GT2 family glycosyltransferase